MRLPVEVNRMQMADRLLSPKHLVMVCGRATGKSWGYGEKADRIARRMPGAVIGLITKTYGMAYTGTLQSALQALDSLGYVRGGNYVVNKRPPEGWPESLAKSERTEHTVSFSNGTRIIMFSQAQKGSVRGTNLDFIMADEAMELDEEQYKKEAVPANRGNMQHFGRRGHHPCHLHHGTHLTTSMPWTRSGRWILKEADYYMEEFGCDIFRIWNRVVSVQQQLLDCTTPKQFAECWNEAELIRAQMPPRVSRSGTLFLLSNAFDNIQFLGLNYIRQMRDSLTRTEFEIEVLNRYADTVADCFYALNAERQMYTCETGAAAMELAARMGYSPESALMLRSSVLDPDCDPTLPLEICPDWGSAISLLVVCQTRRNECDFSTGKALPLASPDSGAEYLYQINEFFRKPEQGDNSVIGKLLDDFCAYYARHATRHVIYYRDRYGDHRNPNVASSKSYNEQAIETLKARGWRVTERGHKGMEPPQNEKYLLWADILAENGKCPVRFRINSARCRYTVISMNNAPVKESHGRFEKDKSSERTGSGTPPEEATHFSDAVDKLVWTKYGERVVHRRSRSAMPMSRRR